MSFCLSPSSALGPIRRRRIHSPGHQCFLAHSRYWSWLRLQRNKLEKHCCSFLYHRIQASYVASATWPQESNDDATQPPTSSCLSCTCHSGRSLRRLEPRATV